MLEHRGKENIAARLRDAEQSAKPIAPFAKEIGEGGISTAYEIQHHNAQHWASKGRSFAGRKIGLTAKSVQRQLGVSTPNYGALFTDMEIASGGAMALDHLIAPRIEAEIAFVIGNDVTESGLNISELSEAVAYVSPAIEVVDSRIQNWEISIVDTIADNGAAARFTIGTERHSLCSLELGSCEMTLLRNGEVVSRGRGSACLGHPLNALRWLADTLVAHNRPLRCGDVVLTGALGPVIEPERGDAFEARFSNMSTIRLSVC